MEPPDSTEGTQALTLDPVVRTCLPPDATIVSIKPHGESFWTHITRIDVKLFNGQVDSYFLKTLQGPRGLTVVYGEYQSMRAIYEAAPTLVPRPLAWGAYHEAKDVHFLLCEFRPMIERVPDGDAFPARLAQLHRTATSPNGRFGFGTTTCHGTTPIEHGWSKYWEEYFTRTTRRLLEMEQKVRGHDPEIQELSGPFFEKVIPRLLRPLEFGARRIRPALVHGDMWHGNVAVDAATNEPIIFDAASFYAHNEYDLGVWRQPWNKLGETHRALYHQHFPPSWPEEDCDDRNLLYATRVNILDSILYGPEEGYRPALVTCMKALVRKFPGGYIEWERSH